jgi:hypothetical protein
MQQCLLARMTKAAAAVSFIIIVLYLTSFPRTDDSQFLPKYKLSGIFSTFFKFQTVKVEILI